MRGGLEFSNVLVGPRRVGWSSASNLEGGEGFVVGEVQGRSEGF